MSDPTALSVADLSRAIRSGEVTPTAVTEAYLDRIQRLNPLINAYTTITADRALADAKRAQDELASGKDRGPLHGVPIALKDLYETANIRTTAGSKIFEDFVPDTDCPVAEKLSEAGSVLLGKTNTHEFAWGSTTTNEWWGATRNPWDTERIPGGSSGGSGAAIAAMMAAATMGTDTGGSIRMPAAHCGCVGLKPTYGRVSKRGVFPMSHLYDHAGPITQTVEDAAIVLGAVAGYDSRDPNSARVPVDDYRSSLGDGVKGMRFGLLRGMFEQDVHPEILSTVNEAGASLRSLGAEVEETDIGVTRELSNRGFRAVFAETHSIHGDNWAKRPQDFGTDMQRIMQVPLPDARGVSDALIAAAELRVLCQSALDRYDALLAPTLMVLSPLIGGSTIIVNGKEVTDTGLLATLTMPFNLARLPVLSLPCGFSQSGLPISLSIVGRPFDEAGVLRIGHAYERSCDWYTRRPNL